MGGYFGAKLAAAGHDVLFIARGEHLGAMQRAGLRVLSPNGDLYIRDAQFLAMPDSGPVVDLVLFCVKSYDTQSVAQQLGPLLDETTTILSLQNGIDNPDKIAALWGARRVLAGVVYIGAEIASPGVIRHSNGGKIVFGRLPGQVADSATQIERRLAEANIPCQLTTSIETTQWSKLLWNAPFCAISCLARADVKQIVDSPILTELAIACMAEVQAAAQLRGVVLRQALFEQTIEFSRGLGGFKPSMLQDLEAGKPLEYEAFNGIVLHLLRSAGRSAPINQTFYALLQQLERSSREITLA